MEDRRERDVSEVVVVVVVAVAVAVALAVAMGVAGLLGWLF